MSCSFFIVFLIQKLIFFEYMFVCVYVSFQVQFFLNSKVLNKYARELLPAAIVSIELTVSTNC